jgi:hypothetical protein
MKAKIEKLMVFLIPTDQVVGDFSQSMIKSDKLLEYLESQGRFSLQHKGLFFIFLVRIL